LPSDDCNGNALRIAVRRQRTYMHITVGISEGA